MFVKYPKKYRKPHDKNVIIISAYFVIVVRSNRLPVAVVVALIVL